MHFQSFNGELVELVGGERFFGRGLRHGNVDVFKNPPRRNTNDALGGFDEVVALTAAVATAESVDKAEGVVELLGVN